MFLNTTLARSVFDAKIELEAAIAQRQVEAGRRELDAKRSMVRHVSHEIRYGSGVPSTAGYTVWIVAWMGLNAADGITRDVVALNVPCPLLLRLVPVFFILPSVHYAAIDVSSTIYSPVFFVVCCVAGRR